MSFWNVYASLYMHSFSSFTTVFGFNDNSLNFQICDKDEFIYIYFNS